MNVRKEISDVDEEWQPYVLPCGHTAAEHESAKQAGAGYLSCDARKGIIKSESDE